jgi:hypothetical protein
MLVSFHRKGTKHGDPVRNHIKMPISIILCGSGVDKMLPWYMVYKGLNMYATRGRSGGMKNT